MTTSPRPSVVILGGGVTGLSSAYRLSQNGNVDVHVVEKEATVGGVCRSFTEGEFTLDYGPHKFYTLIDGIVDELKSIMGTELLEREKTQMLYLGGKYYNFPLKMSEMILRFPPQKTARALASFGTQMIQNRLHPKPAETYQEFLVERFGRELYELIFEPMSKKMFGNPAELDRKLAEVRISAPGLIAVIKQALLGSRVDRTLSAPTFHYPKHGYGMIPQKLKEAAEKAGANFHTSSKVLSIETRDGKVSEVVIQTSSGEIRRLKADQVIYTIPLSALPELVGEKLPTEVRRASKFVAYRHTIIYYYLLKSAPVLPAMWVFCPEPQFRFGRLSEMVKFSPYTAPPGHTALMVDFTCEDKDREWSMDDKELGQLLEDQMKPLKLFKSNQIVQKFSKRFRNFYPVYSLGYHENVKNIRTLETLFQNIYFVGRLGDFNYNNADQCMDMGFKAAEHIERQGLTALDWQETRSRRFEQYKIVD
jgi:protoporphyrinogen oxidase